MKSISLILFFGIFIHFGSCEQIHYKQGERLYKVKCSSCHMDDGSGLSKLIPSLINKESKSTLSLSNYVCIISRGIENKDSMLQMPPHKELTDIEITNLINFIIHDMNGLDAIISLPQTKSYLNQCK